MSNRLIVSHCKCWHHKYGPSVFESKRASSENDLLTWVLLTGISTQWFDSFLFFYISVFTECIFYTETWCQIEDFVWNGLFVNFFFLLIRALQVSCREMGCLWRFCNLPYEHIYLIGLHIFFFLRSSFVQFGCHCNCSCLRHVVKFENSPCGFCMIVWLLSRLYWTTLRFYI